jgi:tagatose 6-phosphate kinase
VTLNAAVDTTYTVPGFTLDRVNRPAAARVTAGGKGVNVARVYQTLGGRATATGFLGARNGDDIHRWLTAEGIPSGFVRVPGESRVCIAIMDPATGTQTEINEFGPTVSHADCDALMDRLRELLPGCCVVVLSGSLPPGTPTTFYRDVIRLAQDEYGVRAVLDASGEALQRGIEAGPYLVKPNIHELTALDITSHDLPEATALLRSRYGVLLAMVTAGPQGAVVCSDMGSWSATPPAVRVLSAVGSGDSLTAGFLWSLLRDDPLPQALRMGVAAGAANVMSYSAGFLDSQAVFNLAVRVTVSQVS